MSDTEEVIIQRSTKPKVSNTKPEIAREKLKEKRERLKKEKEHMIIEEAKKRLAVETEAKMKEELIAKQQEEEKKKADPSYALMLKMEQMMKIFSDRNIPIAPGPIDEFRKAKTKTKAQPKEQELPKPVKQRASKKQIEIVQEEEEEEEEKPKRKPRAAKQIVDKPNKSPGLPKPRKKVVYLQQDPVPEESTQFVGYDIAPPAEPIQYQPSSGLLSALMGRRNMNSYNYYE